MNRATPRSTNFARAAVLAAGGLFAAPLLFDFAWRSVGVPPVAPPRRSSNPAPRSPGVDGWLEEALAAAKQQPNEPDSYVQLATAYMRKQRQSGDPAYYSRAESAARRALKLEPYGYEGRKTLAWVLSGEHRFAEARALAEGCIRERPSDPSPYGVLADAETELGGYQAAVQVVQEMLDRKPDLASYSRAAHQRVLHGDPEGALELWDLALDCGSPRDPEGLAWVHTQKGQTFFDIGQAAKASGEYQRALALQPHYPLALAGEARCRAALGEPRQAMALYESALRAVPRSDWSAALGDLKAALGDAPGAAEQYDSARAAMRAQPPGPDNDRLQALFLVDHHGSARDAVRLALRAARSRADIYTADALAWSLHAAGDDRAAWDASIRARRLGTKDAGLLYHGGIIAQRLPGRRREAAVLLRKALAANPHWHPSEPGLARRALAALTTASGETSTPDAQQHDRYRAVTSGKYSGTVQPAAL